MPIVDVPVTRITDWDSFHDTFAEVLGFPDFYGRNRAAFVDCLTSCDEDDGMTSVVVQSGDVLTLQFDEAGSSFAERCPEQYDVLIEDVAWVNWRRIEAGDRPLVALSFRSPSAPSKGGRIGYHLTWSVVLVPTERAAREKVTRRVAELIGPVHARQLNPDDRQFGLVRLGCDLHADFGDCVAQALARCANLSRAAWTVDPTRVGDGELLMSVHGAFRTAGVREAHLEIEPMCPPLDDRSGGPASRSRHQTGGSGG